MSKLLQSLQCWFIGTRDRGTLPDQVPGLLSLRAWFLPYSGARSDVCNVSGYRRFIQASHRKDFDQYCAAMIPEWQLMRKSQGIRWGQNLLYCWKIVLIGNVAHPYWTIYHSLTDNQIKHIRIQCVVDVCLDEQRILAKHSLVFSWNTESHFTL